MNTCRSRSNSGGRLKTPKSQPRIRSISGSRKLQLSGNLNSSLFADFQSEEDLSDISKIKVYIRIRPFCSNNCENTRIRQEGNNLLVQQGDKELNFACDSIFDESCTQQEVYVGIASNLLEKFIEGCNVCIFAFGQTGSGKTHSILGNNMDPGVLPRFCQDLFDKIADDSERQNVVIEVLFYELYLEKAYDLLSTSRSQVRIRGGDIAYLESVTKVQVDNYSELKILLDQGITKRAKTATLVNEFSSRSHAIFQIVFRRNITEVVNNVEKQSVVLSNCYFVDLAGSERLDMAGYGNRVESAAINCSLLALQKVIDAKSASNCAFVNYRESALTRLLKECFGGNSITALLATINPDFQYTGLSIGTLRFASKAALVRQTPKTNIDPFVTAVQAEYDEMRAELEKLRSSKMHDVNFVCQETPCLIELFADSSLNIWRKLTNIKEEFSAAANDSSSIVCYTRDNKAFINVLDDSVVLNGNFAVKSAEIELLHRDRLVLNGMRFFVFCNEIMNENELKKLPTYESVKLEYVEGTFSIVEEKLREEARREYEEDKNSLLHQMNTELEKAQLELDILKKKMTEETEKLKLDLIKQQRDELETCTIETLEVKKNIQNSSNSEEDNLLSGLNDLKNEEKLELMQFQAFVTTSNNILEKFNKHNLFIFKLIQNSSNEVERVRIRLLNLKSKTFSDLNLTEFRSVFEALVEVYQGSAAICDGVNDIESILYGGNWVWKKSIPGRRSNILSTALYNSMCNVAKSKRSSITQIHRSLVSRKSVLTEAFDLAINNTKPHSVLEAQLQLFRVNNEDNESYLNYSLTNILLKWTFDLSERLLNANDHIINCQKDSRNHFNGIESPEHLAVHAVHLFVVAVCRLETAVNCLDINSIALETIISEMRHLMTLITNNKNRWLLAISAKSESAFFFVNIMVKHLKLMYQLIGRFAFVCGQQFYNESSSDKNGAEILYSLYTLEVQNLFNNGVLQSINETCEGNAEVMDSFEDDEMNIIFSCGSSIPLLCKSIERVHKLASTKFDSYLAFNVIRPLIYIRNIMMESDINFEKIFELLNSVKENLSKVDLFEEDMTFLMTNIESILNNVRISSANSDKHIYNLKNEISPRKSRISFLLNNSQQIIT